MFNTNRVFTDINLYLPVDTIDGITFLVDTGAEDTVVNRQMFRKYPNTVKLIKPFTSLYKDDDKLQTIISKLGCHGNHLSSLDEDSRKYISDNYSRHFIYGINDIASFTDILDVPVLCIDNYSISNCQILVANSFVRPILGMNILKYFDIHINKGKELFELTLNPDWKSIRGENESISNICIQSDIKELGWS